MIKVQKQKINISEQNKKILIKKIGAAVNFTGIARSENKSGNIKYLEIEHYPRMTEKKIKEIEIYATKKWKLINCIIIHRYGKLLPKDNIVLVLTVSKHRKAWGGGRLRPHQGFSDSITNQRRGPEN